jgi:hypothetical protein
MCRYMKSSRRRRLKWRDRSRLRKPSGRPLPSSIWASLVARPIWSVLDRGGKKQRNIDAHKSLARQRNIRILIWRTVRDRCSQSCTNFSSDKSKMKALILLGALLSIGLFTGCGSSSSSTDMALKSTILPPDGSDPSASAFEIRQCTGVRTSTTDSNGNTLYHMRFHLEVDNPSETQTLSAVRVEVLHYDAFDAPVADDDGTQGEEMYTMSGNLGPRYIVHAEHVFDHVGGSIAKITCQAIASTN